MELRTRWITTWVLVAVANQHNSHILWSLGSISLATIQHMSIWIRIRGRPMSSWSTSNFHRLHGTLTIYLGWLLVLKRSHLHLHHVAIDVAREFVCRTLIWISHTLILMGVLGVAHCVTVLVLDGSHVSITLWKSSDCGKSFALRFILVGHELSSASAW